MMKRITIYPTEELRQKIEQEAKSQKRSKSNLILFVLDSYFKNEKKH